MTAETESTARAGTIVRFTGAFAGGAMTTLGLINQILPVGFVGVGLALLFIILLPRRPWVLAGLGAGAVAMGALLAVTWAAGDWGCGTITAGELIEHGCGSRPTATGE